MYTPSRCSTLLSGSAALTSCVMRLYSSLSDGTSLYRASPAQHRLPVKVIHKRSFWHVCRLQHRCGIAGCPDMGSSVADL